MESIDLVTKIRRLRKVLEFSQENLGMELQITQYAYSKIENGRTRLTFDHLKGIAKCFGCSVGELVDLPLNELIGLIGMRTPRPGATSKG